jgi:5-methylcytosine-specific restriction endonuclease McrA
MPWRPPRACPRCGGVLPDCLCRARLHAPPGPLLYNRRAWRRLSQSFRARFPFCGQRADGLFYGEHSHCTRQGRELLAVLVDHIRPVHQGGAPLEESNLQSLCFLCHQRKSSQEHGSTWGGGRES